MKILLVSVNRLTQPYPVYPLGLDHVAGPLVEQHEVLIHDCCVNPATSLGSVVEEFRPGLVGLSVRNIDNTDIAAPRSFVAELRELVQEVRTATAAPVVLGGAGYSIFPTELLARTGADFGIVGEGEWLSLLVEALAAGSATPELPGLVRPRGPAPRLRLLEDLPPRPQAPRGASVDWYLRHGGMLSVQTQRGCSRRCVYCTYPLIEGRRPRRRPPHEVAQTALRLQHLGARYLWITDSVFNLEVDHSLGVARALREAGLTIPWGAFFAPDRPRHGYYQELRACGLTHAEFGTESLDDPVLAALGKGFTVEDALAAHRAAREAGLHVAHYFMLGGPGETAASIEQTLQRAEQLDRAALFFFCGTRIYPGTRLHELARQEGRLDPATDLLEPTFYHAPELPPPAEILERVQERAAGRLHWVVGAGSTETASVVERLYARGRTGPLWEKLVR